MYEARRRSEIHRRRRQETALLISLAGRVERSALRFSFLRFFLLWLLRPVERVACKYVLCLARDMGVLELIANSGLFDLLGDNSAGNDTAAQALHMGMRLRALASVLAWLSASEAVEDRKSLRSEQRRERRATLAAPDNARGRSGAVADMFCLWRPEVRRGLSPGYG